MDISILSSVFGWKVWPHRGSTAFLNGPCKSIECLSPIYALGNLFVFGFDLFLVLVKIVISVN
jgi:hypothetical protein